MTILEERLRALGDQLDVDEATVAERVLARLDEQATAGDEAGNSSGRSRRTSRSAIASGESSSPRRILKVVAVLFVATAAAVVAVPSTRQAVADWFGLDGVTIERESGLEVPTTADPIGDAADAGLGTVAPGVDADVLVSEFSGSIDTDALTKTIGDGTDIRRVDVNGAAGLWIDGDPHEVAYQDASGQFVVERFAGNTLLWQDGTVVRRLEGFETFEQALAYALALDD